MTFTNDNDHYMSDGKVYHYHDPIHPGAFLQSGWLEPLHLSAKAFSKLTGIPFLLLGDVLSGHAPITRDIAQTLALHLQTDPNSWIQLQREFDVAVEYKNVSEALSLVAPFVSIWIEVSEGELIATPYQRSEALIEALEAATAIIRSAFKNRYGRFVDGYPTDGYHGRPRSGL